MLQVSDLAGQAAGERDGVGAGATADRAGAAAEQLISSIPLLPRMEVAALPLKLIVSSPPPLSWPMVAPSRTAIGQCHQPPASFADNERVAESSIDGAEIVVATT